MPTYQYKCLTCDTTFDKMNVAIEERDEQKCEKCDTVATRSYVVGNVSVWAPTSGGYR